MGDLIHQKQPSTLLRVLRIVLAMLGLLSAGAALLLTNASGIAEVATIVAIAALAILAGHAWAIPILTIAEVVLVGILWPMAVHQSPPDPFAQFAVYCAMISALPALIIFHRTFPHLVELLFGRSPRSLLRDVYVQGIGLTGAGVWLAAPLWN